MFFTLAMASGNIQEWGDVSLSGFLVSFQMGSLPAGLLGWENLSLMLLGVGLALQRRGFT